MKHILHTLKHSFSAILLLALLGVPGVGWGQAISEGFEGSFPPSGWSNSGCIQTSNNPRSGTRNLGFNGANDAIITPLMSNPDVLSFWYRRSSNTTAWGLSIQLLNSSNTVVATLTAINSATETYQQYSADLSSYSNVKVRLTDTRSTGTHERYVDDFSVTHIPSGTPDIALSNNGTQVEASNVNQGTSAHILHKFALTVTTANASLTGMTCTTAGTYTAADITNLKVRYSADANLESGDATLSTLASPGTAGNKTFTSFTSQSITSGSTGYIFITADIAANATHNNTISLDAITTANLTFASGNKTGSTTAGGVQTIKDVTVPTVSTYSPSDGNTAVTVNQNLVLTFTENIQVGTAGNFVIYNSNASEFESIPYNDSRITFATNTVTINPTGTFAIGAGYYVQIPNTAIKDAAGNAYAGIGDATTWNFATVGPTVTNVTSTTANGTYKTGDLITIIVTFSANVVVTGTPQLQLETGTTDEQVNYSSGSGSAVLTFLYTVLAGNSSTDLDYKATTSLTLNSGTISSAGGIAALLALPIVGGASSIAGQKAIVIDGVAPTVSNYSPADGNTAATVNQNLMLTFTENVQVGTAGNFVIYNSDASEFESIPYNDPRITFSTNTVTVNPTGTFAIGAGYYIQIPNTAIRDGAGNAYAGIGDATTWNFSTVAPSVTNVTSTNADGTYKVGDIITVTVTFTGIVNVTGSPYILLNMVGTDRQAAYAGGTGTTTLSFNHTIVATDGASDLDYVTTTSLLLNGGSINSPGGIAATRTLATPGAANSLGFNKNIVVDGVAPTVTTYSPIDGSTSATINQNLILTFNENVKVGTSGNIIIYNAGGTVFETIPYNDGRITFSTNTATINPTGTFAYSSDYYLQTTGSVITDMYDNAYAGINIATTWNFTTVCGPVSSFPYTIDFSTYLPTCWSESVGILASPSTLSGTTSAWIADGYANSGSTGSARINIFGTGIDDWLITPTIDLGTTTDYQLEFDLALTDYDNTNPITSDLNGTTGVDDKFAVVISTDNGNTWTSANTLMLWDNAGSTNIYNSLTPAGTHVTINLASYSGEVKIGFYGESTVSNADNDLFIDNVLITEVPSCVMPTSVIASLISSTSATISWTASVSLPSNGYQYEVRTSGAAGSGATGLTTAGTTAAGVVTANLSALADNTSYTVYVRSDCGSGDYSVWTTSHSFSTTNVTSPTANSATSIGATGFTANWGSVIGASSYKIDVYTETAGSYATDLFISEYVEGSSNNKAIELYNGTGVTINLADYTLVHFNGGASRTSGTRYALTFTNPTNLPNGSTFVIANESSSAGILAVANLATNSAVMTFNGDDALAIYRAIDVTGTTINVSAVEIDILGKIGEDPGSEWGSGLTSTSDNTLQRKSSITSGVTTNPALFDPSLEYNGFAIDNISGLGSHIFSGGTTQTFIQNDQTVNGTSLIITGLDPNTEYKYRVRAVGSNSTSANSNVITVTTTDFEESVTVSENTNWSFFNNVDDGTNITVNSGVELIVDVASAECNNLTVNAGGKLTVAAGKNLIINNDFTLKSPSNMGPAGSFIDWGTTLVIGNYIIERYIAPYTADNNGWHFMASPFNEDVEINSTTFDPGTNDDLYAWDESQATDNWRNHKVGYPVSFEAGEGYLVAYALPSTHNFTLDGNTFTHVTSDVGLLFDAAITPETYDGGGWYLLGNSFLSAVTWDPTSSPWLLEGIEIAAQVLNDEAANYIAVDEGDVIQAMQGFFVKVTDGDNFLGLPEALRVHSSSNFLKNTIADNITLKVTSDANSYYDLTKVRFRNGATESYDTKFDASKMFGWSTAPQLYTKSASGRSLSINALPVGGETVVVPLDFEAKVDGNYVISVENSTLQRTILLRDKLTETSVNLSTVGTYSFTGNPDQEKERFELSFLAPTGIDNPAIASSISVYTHGETLYISGLEAKAEISVINLTGQVVISSRTNGSGLHSVNAASLPKGVYVVSVISNGQSISRKVVL